MKNSIFFQVFILSFFNLTMGQTVSLNDGTTYITLSADFEDALVHESTPIVISNTTTLKISGQFESCGYYDSETLDSYDIAIIPKPNTSIAVVENTSDQNSSGGNQVMPPKNGTTVIRTSGGTVGKLSQTNVVAFPNPVNTVLNVEAENTSINSYTIFDFNGTPLITSKLNNRNELTLNLEELKSGKYILKLEFENGASKSIQFVKQ